MVTYGGGGARVGGGGGAAVGGGALLDWRDICPCTDGLMVAPGKRFTLEKRMQQETYHEEPRMAGEPSCP